MTVRERLGHVWAYIQSSTAVIITLSRVTFNHVSVCIYECVRMNVCVCLCMHELVCVYVMISGVIIGVDSEEINSVRVSIC